MAAPAHRTFRLTPTAAKPWRQQFAWAGLAMSALLLLASSFLMCACSPFMVPAGLCAVPALIFGPLRYRVVAVILLSLATLAVISDSRAERRTMEAAHRAAARSQTPAP